MFALVLQLLVASQPLARGLLAPIIIVVVALAGLVSTAFGVTPAKKTFSELVSEAEVVVVGIVSRTQGLQLAEGPIVTDITLDILRSVKGKSAPGSSLVLRILGGKVGDVELAIGGAPSFRLGQTVLLFVRGNMSEMFPFVGVQQGVFFIRPDGSLGAERVFDWLGRPVSGIRDDEVSLDPGGIETNAVTVESFVREIEQRLRP